MPGMSSASIAPLIIGMFGVALSFVFGAVLADPVIDGTTTALTNASIGSFAGASSVGGLIPLVYFTIVILLGLGSLALVGAGARRLARG